MSHASSAITSDAGIIGVLSTNKAPLDLPYYGQSMLSSGYVIDHFAKAFSFATTQPLVGWDVGFVDTNPTLRDLTDGAGHGILVATDSIFLTGYVPSNWYTNGTNTVFVKLLYRWKDVSLAEYIGIVQSQQ